MTWHSYKSGLMQNIIYQHLKQYDNSHEIIYIRWPENSQSNQAK